MSEKKIKDKELIPKEEIEKLRAETEQQLNYARQQVVLLMSQPPLSDWIKKVEQLTGSLAMCNVILAKKPEKIKETK